MAKLEQRRYNENSDCSLFEEFCFMPIDITLPTQFHGILSTIGWFDVLDILIVAVILYI